MAIGLAPIFKTAYYSLALLGGLYLLFVFTLTFPFIQRNAIYAHRVNPTWWQNLSDVEAFGFLNYQVQPFTLVTPDNETLYAWHILPLHLAEQHSTALLAQEDFGVKTSDQVVDTVSFDLLSADANANVVVNFHGNAGHLASSHRPFTYQRFLGLSSKSRPVHLIAFDYRGFGLSSGTPTEDGLIIDAETVLSFLTGLHLPSHLASKPNPVTLSIPPSNIILTSQSLGTAVSTALLHRWTLLHNFLPPRLLVLTSPFPSLPALVESYSIKGLIPPLLSPFRSYPFLMNRITAHVADTWQTSARLGELLASTKNVPISVEILHAKDDREIPWWEADRLWQQVMRTVLTTGNYPFQDGAWIPTETAAGPGSQVKTWKGWRGGSGQHEKRARFTRTRFGGHNRLACSEEASAAVWRALEM